MAVREFWRAYWQTVIAALAVIIGVAAALRIVLEAYFRGGARYFWIFVGSRLARTAILSALALILGVLVWSDRTAGVLFLAAVVLLGAWFVATVVETLIRKDAVELLAYQLPLIAAAMGLVLMFEVLSALFLTGVSAAAILLSSRAWEFLAAMGLAAISAMVWSVLESYLLVVRFSMVDIMRGEE